MMHVPQIAELIESGHPAEAEKALENLLALGPHNTSALKLKAKLHEFKGELEKEVETWKKIHEIDIEDRDAYAFFQLKSIEEQEHQFFTDVLADGSHRILVYQRGLILPKVVGFFGSLFFIIATNYYIKPNPALMNPVVLIGLFTLTVAAPVIWAIYKFFTTTFYYTLSKEKLVVATRIKSKSYRWNDFEKIVLSRTGGMDESNLSIIFIPKDKSLTTLEIDFSKRTTCIRSRHAFLKELSYYFKKPEILQLEKEAPEAESSSKEHEESQRKDSNSKLDSAS